MHRLVMTLVCLFDPMTKPELPGWGLPPLDNLGVGAFNVYALLNPSKLGPP